MNLVKHVKETQITDCCDRIIKIINMNIEDSSNVPCQKFQIDDSMLEEKYPLLNSLHIPLIPHLVSTISFEIIKLLEQFPIRNILSLKHWRGTESTAISIPK